MKKKIKISFLLLFGLLLINTGCTTEKDTFEHTDLLGKDPRFYSYQNKEDGDGVYALVDITPEKSETAFTGLYYEVGENDYILLEILETSDRNSYQSDTYYQFFDNKLYSIGGLDGVADIYVTTLKGKNSTIQPLLLYYEGKENPFLITMLEEVDATTISFKAHVTIDNHNEYRSFRCSLEDNTCMLADE